jgi:hypothetical protein
MLIAEPQGFGGAILVIVNVKIPQAGAGQVSITINLVPAVKFKLTEPPVFAPVTKPPSVFAVVGAQAL